MLLPKRSVGHGWQVIQFAALAGIEQPPVVASYFRIAEGSSAAAKARSVRHCFVFTAHLASGLNGRLERNNWICRGGSEEKIFRN